MSFRYKHKRNVGHLLIALLGATIAGCGGSSSSSSSNDGNGDVDADGAIRMIHSALDAGDVDIYVDDTMAVERHGYTEATEYLEKDEDGNAFTGTIEVQFVEPLGDPETDTLQTATLDLEDDSRKTLILHGESGQEALQVVDEAGGSGTSVRFSHFAEDLDEVDIFFEQGDDVFGHPDDLTETPVATNVSAGDVGDWENFDAGEDGRLILTNAQTGDLVFDSGVTEHDEPLYLSTGDRVHVVFTSLTPAEVSTQRNFSYYDGIGLVESESPGNDPVASIKDKRLHIHFINAVADAGELMFQVDDIGETGSVEYQKGTEIVEVTRPPDPAGSVVPAERLIRVIDPAIGEADPVFSESQELNAGRRYVYVLTGSETEDDWAFAEQEMVVPLEIVEHEMEQHDDERIIPLGVYAYHGYDSITQEVDLEFDDTYYRTISNIPYKGIEGRLTSFTVTIDEGSNQVAFREDCCEDEHYIIEENVDLVPGEFYTFVLGGIFTGSDVPDLFVVEGPWEEVAYDSLD